MNAIEQLYDRIKHEFGLRERTDFLHEVERTAVRIAGQRGCRVEDLVHRVESDPELLFAVAGSLAVGETHFFRLPGHFAVAVSMLSERLRQVERKPLVVWSAGCASGEEPYSVAMSVEASLGAAALDHVVILGTDMNPQALAKAKRATYTTWSLRGTPPAALERYFELRGRDCQVTHERIRRSVSFDLSGVAQRALDLASASVDIVFFRNVGIYLEPEPLDALYAEFARVVRPEGVLLIAPADPRPAPSLFAPEGDSNLPVLKPLGPMVQPEAERPTVAPPPTSARRSTKPRPSKARVPSKPQRVMRARPQPRQANTPVAAGDNDLVVASSLASRGDFDRAMALVTSVIGSGAETPAAYALRGRILLDRLHVEQAVEDLRRAVYLEPESIMARFWYATALKLCSKPRALKQLVHLEQQLAVRTPDALLEDDETSSTELLQAVRFMQEELR